jgi:ketosteroid isomerase-like protein
MQKRVILILVGALFLLAPARTPAQAPNKQGPLTKEDPAHEELRGLKKELTQAVNSNNLEALLALLDDDVVVTWENAEVSRGPQQVRAYYDRMMKGDQRIVESVTIDPTVDELTHLYGDTGVAFGSSTDHFKLRDGRDFVFDTRWTATAVKKNGKWKVASFHASTNTFDNPVLWIAVKRVGLWTGVIAGVLGLVVGFITSRWLRKRTMPAS